jgi:CHAD domain-containing protein
LYLRCQVISLKGYTLYKHELAINGIRRIIRWQLKYALDLLRDESADKEKVVHELRKTLKRIRAVLRLVRVEIGEDQFKQYNLYLRDTARKIAPLRDVAVYKAMVKHIASRNPHTFDEPLKVLLNDLDQEYMLLAKKYFEEEKILSVVQEDLEKMTDMPKKLWLFHKNFGLFYGGLLRVFERGRNQLQDTIRVPTMENFHDLRKRVKYLWHIHQVLKQSWPRMFNLISKSLEESSENLGLEHDLAILSRYILSKYEPEKALDQFTPLLQFIAGERENLQARILSSAYYLYAEKPVEFTRRMQKYWNISRSEPVRKRNK